MTASADMVNTRAVSTTPADCDYKSCHLTGIHDIEIINQSGMPHTYKYSYQMCMTIEGYNTCTNAQNTITVNPWQTWENHRDSKLDMKLPYKGPYAFFVITQIRGDATIDTRNDYKVNAG